MKDKLINIFNSLIKDKKKLGLVIGIVCIVIILIIFVIMFFKDDRIIAVIKNPDGVKIKSEYEKLNDVESEDGKLYPEVILPSNNILRYTNISEILRIFDKDEDAVVYFGYSTCLYCRSAIEVLCDVASSSGLDTIYYLNVEEDLDKYDELLNVLGDRFIIVEDGNNKLYVPLVIFIVDGNIVSYKKGTLFSQDNPYQELDEYQVEGLGEIYKYGIDDVLDGMKY